MAKDNRLEKINSLENRMERKKERNLSGDDRFVRDAQQKLSELQKMVSDYKSAKTLVTGLTRFASDLNEREQGHFDSVIRTIQTKVQRIPDILAQELHMVR